VPCAVLYFALAEPLSVLAFGAEFEDAAGPLRLLAPVTILISIVLLCSSLIVSRGRPTVMVVVTTAIAALNIVLNVALVPAFEDDGAAAAMLATEVVFLVVVMRISARLVGGVRWLRTGAAPLLAGAPMLGLAVSLDAAPLVVAAASFVLYGAVLLAVERAVNPDDLRFVQAILRRRPAPHVLP
jgi:O-antigen/teichoic acid export membrane protein